jgi:F-type H+-transporting ATPase subunit b
MKLVFLVQDFSEVLGDVSARIFPSVSALITQLIATAIMFIIVKKYLWKPVTTMLETRKAHIAKTVTDADEKLKQALEKETLAEQKVKEAYKQAWTIVDDAKVNALNQRDDIIAKAEQEAKAKREQASRDIEAEKIRAERQIRAEIIDVALEAARKVVAREVTSSDNLKLVEDFVREVDLHG